MSSTQTRYATAEILTRVRRLIGQQSGDIHQVEEFLPQLVKDASAIYTDIPSRDDDRGVLAEYLQPAPTDAQPGFQQLLKRVNSVSSTKLMPLMPLMGQLRVVKSEAEISNMRKAGQWSSRAITSAMRKNWDTERSLHSFLDYNFKVNGCEEEAYEPVVASDKVTFLSVFRAALTMTECTKHSLHPQRFGHRTRLPNSG
jgi:Xaa-Pro aminopeptidase